MRCSIEGCYLEVINNSTICYRHVAEVTNELPKWKWHKVVVAVKIEVIRGEGIFWGSGRHIFVASRDYFEKHKPEEGGYYVRYEDGYESYSPAEAFEAGYTKIWPIILAEAAGLGDK